MHAQMPVNEILGELSVSRETEERLRDFQRLLARWSPKINLVARDTLVESWSRHILDSAQLISISGVHTQKWCDLGSGGGAPGLIVAILLRELSPQAIVTMIESDARKSSFLKIASTTLGLTTNVICSRIECAPKQHADMISARALAPLERLLHFVHRHSAKDGQAVLPKGQRFEEEIVAARRNWEFKAEVIQSKTNPQSRILRISDLFLKEAQA